jgi:hypothetical protein
MKGIQYVSDESGRRTAVPIGLKDYEDGWEDVYDILVSQSRKNESTLPWKKLEAEIGKKRRKTFHSPSRHP